MHVFYTMSLGCIVIHRLQCSICWRMRVILCTKRQALDKERMRTDTVRNCGRCNRRYAVFDSILFSDSGRRQRRLPDSKTRFAYVAFVSTKIHFMSVRTLLAADLSWRAFVGIVSSIIFTHTHTRKLNAYGYRQWNWDTRRKKWFSSCLWFCHVMFVADGVAAKQRRSLTKSNRLEAITTISALQTTDCSRDALPSQCQQQPSTAIPTHTHAPEVYRTHIILRNNK